MANAPGQGKQQPMFAFKIVPPDNETITVTFDDLSTANLNIPIGGLEVYNARDAGGVADLVTLTALFMSAADGGGTWSRSEPAGTIKGRVTLSTTRTDGKVATQLTLSASFARLLGFETTTPTGTDSFTGLHQRGGMWIAYPADNVFVSKNLPTKRIASSKFEVNFAGYSSLDLYGTGVTTRLVRIIGIWGASAREFYASQADFAAKVGNDVDDPNIAWDSFLQLWWAETQGRTGLFFPDESQRSATQYTTFQPRPPWIDQVEPVERGEGLIETDPAPLTYNLVVTLQGGA